MMRFYRLLLFLYPSWFRNDYREELCRAFAERTRGRSALAVCVMALGDVVPNAMGVHWDMVRHGLSGGLTFPTIWSDVRLAVRQIAHAPLFSGVIIAVIALGIGINAGLLTTLHVYAWRPAPGIAQDATLARLTPMASRTTGGRTYNTAFSYPEILDLRAQRDAFKDVAAFAATTLAADFGNGAELVRTTYVTDNYFRTLRVPMAAGPGFPTGIERTDDRIAVIGHSVWMTYFRGSPDAIGKTIRVMNVPFSIVGVAPERFVGVDVKALGSDAVWIPLGTLSAVEPDSRYELRSRDAAFLDAFVRLAPRVGTRDVESMTGPLAARLVREAPKAHSRLVIRAEHLNGMQQSESSTRELYAAFFIVAVLIVVITCTNVSALLLGRAVARRREIGVRLSLGATRLRLICQLLTESLVHAIAGAVLAMILYAVAMKIAYATIPDIIPGLEPEPATFAYAAAFALVTTIVFGLAPALHATRADIGEVIKNSGTNAIRRSRLQALFVIVQLASSQPVLVVSSLVLADLRGGSTNAGKAPGSVVTMESSILRPESPDSSTDAKVTLDVIRQRIRQIPGVSLATIATRGNGESFALPGSGDSNSGIQQIDVAPDYFATLGLPIVRGRAIGVDENRRGAVGVVVSEEFAKGFWPEEDPVGKRLIRRAHNKNPESTLEVIGVAGRAPYSDERPAPIVFAPLANAASVWQSTIMVRTSGDARRFMPQIRTTIRDVEPYATVGKVATLAEQAAQTQRETLQANAAALGVSIAALILASLGLYAIIAFAVEQRTREIGIRLAVGATPGGIVGHFFRNGVRVSAIGLGIGLPLTVIGIRVVQASVIGFTLQNVFAVMLVVPVLIGVAMLASWLPARRAGRVDPLMALRSE
jgi:putative ABC transport system permease protein